jgi:hypothetical protein
VRSITLLFYSERRERNARRREKRREIEIIEGGAGAKNDPARLSVKPFPLLPLGGFEPPLSRTFGPLGVKQTGSVPSLLVIVWPESAAQLKHESQASPLPLSHHISLICFLTD